MTVTALASVRPTGLGAGSASADQDLVREAYQQHHDRLIGFFVRWTGDHGLAEDLTHDAFVRLVGAVDRLDPALPVWPYLREIARNLVIDRQARDRRQVGVDVEEQLRDQPDPRQEVGDVTVLRCLLAQAIGELSQAQQVAVMLRCARGWSGIESAEFLGIDQAALRQLLFRARKNLREALDKSDRRALRAGAARPPPR